MLSSYVTYLACSVVLVLVVGATLYRNGAIFLRDVFDDAERAAAVNRLLLVGFYLVNIGFVLLTSSIGAEATVAAERYQNLTLKLGAVALLLGVMHLTNLSALNRVRHSRLMETRRLAASRQAIGQAAPYAPAPTAR